MHFFSIDCVSEMCYHTATKSENSTERCVMNECSKYVDILSIMVVPKTCETSLLVVSFSSYENFVLFSSNRMNGNRQLILYSWKAKAVTDISTVLTFLRVSLGKLIIPSESVWNSLSSCLF